MKPEITKFNFLESFNSPNGKTSLPLICSWIVILTGCFGFFSCGLSMVIFTWRQIPTTTDLATMALQSSGVIAMGVGLLGIRRFTPDKPLTDCAPTPPAPAQ